MHLGEFLAESGAITYRQLLESLSYQFHMQRFAPCVAEKSGIMSSKEAARVLRIAMEKHGPLTEITSEVFVRTALSENAITAAQAISLRAACRQKHMPIGQVLVQTGAIEEKDIPNLLRQFISKSSESSSKSTA